MDISNMKNMIVLRNLPSNLVEEAIVVLKENKRVKKYQYADGKNVDINKKKTNETANQSEYIIKEAENVISHYITNLETKSPKWKNNFKKLEKKYKKSLKLNFALVFVSLISILISVI